MSLGALTLTEAATHIREGRMTSVELVRDCLARIEELRRSGTTIVFVSHDMAAVERLCDRAFWLEHGRICSEGATRSVVRDYYDGMLRRLAGQEQIAPALTPSADGRVAAELQDLGEKPALGQELVVREVATGRELQRTPDRGEGACG